jgi:hypothetical protein
MTQPSGECDPDTDPGFMDDPCEYNGTECFCGGRNSMWNCDDGGDPMGMGGAGFGMGGFGFGMGGSGGT